MNPKQTKFFFFSLFLMLFFSGNLLAQSKAEVFDGSTQITWLGLDFSQTNFIGTAAQFNEAGAVSNEEFRIKYIPAWNELFVNEQKKYDVARAMHRSEVKYGLEVTTKSNTELNKDFFSQNPNDFKTLDEQKIAEVVKKYDFLDKKGIGMIFFVEGMSKGIGMAGVWVTFVDMEKKSVLFTVYQTGKVGGFGFRNYWARPYYQILKSIEFNYKKWKK